MDAETKKEAADKALADAKTARENADAAAQEAEENLTSAKEAETAAKTAYEHAEAEAAGKENALKEIQSAVDELTEKAKQQADAETAAEQAWQDANDAVTAAEAAYKADQEAADAALEAAQTAYANIGKEFLDSKTTMTMDEFLEYIFKNYPDLKKYDTETFRNSIAEALTVEKLQLSADAVIKANELREKETVRSITASNIDLKIGYDLTQYAIVANAFNRTGLGIHQFFSLTVGQKQTAYSSAENWSSTDSLETAFRGLYDSELAKYQKYLETYTDLNQLTPFEISQNYAIVYNNTGHYLNLVNSQSKYMGVGCDGKMTQNFASYISGKSDTPEDFKTNLADFAASGKNTLDAAQAAVEALKKEPEVLTTAKANAAAAQAAYKAAGKAYEDTVAELNEKKAEKETAQTALNQANEIAAEKKSAYEKAVEAVSDADEAVKKAEEAAKAAETAQKQAQDDAADAAQVLTACEENRKNAAETLETLEKKLAEENQSYNAAKTAYEEATAVRDANAADLKEKEATLKAATQKAEDTARAAADAQNAYEEAVKAVEAAQKESDDAQKELEEKQQKVKKDSEYLGAVETAQKTLADAEEDLHNKNQALKDAQEAYDNAEKAKETAAAQRKAAEDLAERAQKLTIDSLTEDEEFSDLNDRIQNVIDARANKEAADAALADAQALADAANDDAEDANRYLAEMQNNLKIAKDNLTRLKPLYMFIDGDGETYNKTTDGAFIVATDGKFSWFDDILIDGRSVDPADYTASEGSTYITLNKDFMDTLTNGVHTVSFLYDYDITSVGAFYVTEDTADDREDNSSEENSSDNTSVSDATSTMPTESTTPTEPTATTESTASAESTALTSAVTTTVTAADQSTVTNAGSVATGDSTDIPGMVAAMLAGGVGLYIIVDRKRKITV